MIVSAAAGHTAQHPLQDGGPMRKLVVNTFVSLDGVMQAPGGPEEDPTGGFELGGWGANCFDDARAGGMEQLDVDCRRPRRIRRDTQAPGRPRDPGSRQLGSDPDAART